MRRTQATVFVAMLLAAGCDSGGSSKKQHTLTIDVVGEGTTSPAAGAHRYDEGTTVTLTATPAGGSTVRGWTGDATGTTAQVTVRLNGDRQVTALFTRSAWPTGPAATYDNPVLPGDHPDLNLFREGEDFYIAGSNFAIFPALEILHSTDLLHWERVSRVVDANAAALDGLTDPGEGTWGAFITRREPSGYRIYFAINATQWFAEADELAGPWSAPVQVTPFPISPDGGTTFFDRGTGSDNSVFVDPDSGKTFMVTKNGIGPWLNETDNFFGMNRLVEIDLATGQLVEASMINLDFVNFDPETGGDGPVRDYSSWAEGPTMTWRDGWYYYFVQTHTACGGNTDVWASQTLDSDPAHWHWLGFPATQIDPYRGAQHPTAPFELADGSWWVFEHSYDCTAKGTVPEENGEWLGLAREGLLHQVTWVDTEIDGITIPVPTIDKNTRNLPAPGLAQSGTFLVPANDEFSGTGLATQWTTYARMGDQLSVADGALTISPDADPTVWALQKDALRSTASLVKLDFVPQADGEAAGLCVRNGYWNDQQLLSGPTWIEGEGLIVGSHDVQVARTMIGGVDTLRFAYRMRRPVPVTGTEFGDYNASGLADPVVVSYTVPTPTPAPASLWLKLVRSDHRATGWFSADRLTWTQVGEAIDISALDDHYGMAHSWIGSQAGMFATEASAEFDLFTYRDGLTAIPATATDQQSGTAVVASTARGSVLGELQSGDWALYAGVDLGSGGVASTAARIEASSVGGGWFEVWLDPLAGGPHFGPCRVADTGGWETFAASTCALGETTGTHDVYLKVVGAAGQELMRIASLQFVP